VPSDVKEKGLPNISPWVSVVLIIGVDAVIVIESTIALGCAMDDTATAVPVPTTLYERPLVGPVTVVPSVVKATVLTAVSPCGPAAVKIAFGMAETPIASVIPIVEIVGGTVTVVKVGAISVLLSAAVPKTNDVGLLVTVVPPRGKTATEPLTNADNEAKTHLLVHAEVADTENVPLSTGHA